MYYFTFEIDELVYVLRIDYLFGSLLWICWLQIESVRKIYDEEFEKMKRERRHFLKCQKSHMLGQVKKTNLGIQT